MYTAMVGGSPNTTWMEARSLIPELNFGPKAFYFGNLTQ